MEEVMSENKDVIKYQWKKGENFGKVVEVASTDKDFIHFTDGSRIFKTVVGEFLEKVQGDNLPLPGAEIVAAKLAGEEVQQTESVQNQDISVTLDKPLESKVYIQQNEPTVMGKMIMKMSKKNVVSVPLQINLNIPTPALHAMLSEGMEAEDLNEEIIQVALQQIEIDKLQDYVRENITNFLTEYYS